MHSERPRSGTTVSRRLLQRIVISGVPLYKLCLQLQHKAVFESLYDNIQTFLSRSWFERVESIADSRWWVENSRGRLQTFLFGRNRIQRYAFCATTPLVSGGYTNQGTHSTFEVELKVSTERGLSRHFCSLLTRNRHRK